MSAFSRNWHSLSSLMLVALAALPAKELLINTEKNIEDDQLPWWNLDLIEAGDTADDKRVEKTLCQNQAEPDTRKYVEADMERIKSLREWNKVYMYRHEAHYVAQLKATKRINLQPLSKSIKASSAGKNIKLLLQLKCTDKGRVRDIARLKNASDDIQASKRAYASCWRPRAPKRTRGRSANYRCSTSFRRTSTHTMKRKLREVRKKRNFDVKVEDSGVAGDAGTRTASDDIYNLCSVSFIFQCRHRCLCSAAGAVSESNSAQ